MSEEIPFHKRLSMIRDGSAPKTTGKKPPKGIAKQSEKKKKEIAEGKDENGDNELVRFYKACMKKMTGSCMNCHGRTETKVYSAAIFSICHILDKRDTMCPSVATHPLNWVELCVDCHREFDSPPMEKEKTLWDKRMEMGVWPIVGVKLVELYPDIEPSERRHFPESLFKYVTNQSS